ncbi:MAG: SMI1/KNR4 family protein [Bacteroidota bacterium]|nr:SMI1/KNR4 family protein [Bacteroidota bacterium]
MNRIKKKLEQLWDLDHKFLNESEHFEKHQYIPFTEANITLFEEKHQIKLPATYRDFLLQVCNGGVGPGNGILPLNIKQEFPKLHLPWIDPLEYNDLFLFDPIRDNYDTYDDKINKARLKDNEKVDKLIQGRDNGQLPIADDGCGMYYFLVVKGTNKGEIWLNHLVTDGGFEWVANSFGAWFEHWLDQSILSAHKNNQALQELYGDEKISSFLPKNVEELRDLVFTSNHLKDKNPVKNLLKRILEQNPSQEIVEQSIDYLLYDEHYRDVQIALRFLTQSLANLDEAGRKKNLCQQGNLFFDLGNFQRALHCFQSALALEGPVYHRDELEEPYLRLICQCHLKSKNQKAALETMGMVDEAVLLLEEIHHKYNDHVMAVEWGEIIIDANKFKEDEEFEDYLQDIYLVLIYANAALKNNVKAHEHLDKLIELKANPNTIPYENIVENLINVHNYGLAIWCLEKYSGLLRSIQNMEWLHYAKGQCFFGLEKLQEARDCFEKSYELKHWVAPYAQLIGINKKLGELKAAEQIKNEVLALNPKYLENINYL